MKKYMKAIISLFLCLCLSMGAVLPAMAANESNTKNVTFSAELDNNTLDVSSSEQTVVMTVSTNQSVSANGIGGTVTWDKGLTLNAISNSDGRIMYTDVNLVNGEFFWFESQVNVLNDITNIAVITFKVPANTPAGTYKVGIKNIELTEGTNGVAWESGASATATLTIKEPSEAGGYTAGLTATTEKSNVGGTVNVTVNAGHSSDTQFASAQVVLEYDSAKLTFVEDCLENQSDIAYTDKSGVLTITRYGDAKDLANAFSLTFTAAAAGQTQVKLTSAGFSDKTAAETKDLTAAAISPAAVTIVISEETYAVILPSGFEGNSIAVKGQPYTFAIVDENHTYSNITAKIGDQPVEVTDNQNGTYTIAAGLITGALTITATETANVYDVSITEDTYITAPNKATYGVDYTFKLKTDVDPTIDTDGTSYTLKSITIGGKGYTNVTTTGNEHTISGTAITGDIVIEVEKETVPAGSFSVKIEGTGVGHASVDASVVTKDGSSNLTLTPKPGFTYTVKATMGGTDVTNEMTIDENVYKLSNITGPVVFTVNRTVDTSKAALYDYLTLKDEKTMFLVTYKTGETGGKVADGMVPTYDGNSMYWSEKYNAYCYLVVAETLNEDTAKAAINIVEGAAVVVDYTMDVNKSGKEDVNDAQLVYNMYNATYSGFTESVTVEKFLRADVNWDNKVNSQDAAAIINAILNPNP